MTGCLWPEMEAIVFFIGQFEGGQFITHSPLALGLQKLCYF
jgi:hypothetical protein